MKSGKTAAPGGQNYGMLRASSVLAVILGAALTVLLVTVAYRVNFTWENPVDHLLSVSARTSRMLSESQGSIRVACFMDRRHPMFRPVSRLLRGLSAASRRVAGAEIRVEYVDPHWDLARASQLTSQNIPENALVFERQRRRVVVTLDDMLTEKSALMGPGNSDNPDNRDNRMPWETKRAGRDLGIFRGESVCASAIARLALPNERTVVYWLTGHGEARMDDYDSIYGFSTVAREVARDGFELRELALPGHDTVPADCSVLVAAGPRKAFTARELDILSTYLQRGGRLLLLLNPSAENNFKPLMSQWGVELTDKIAVSGKTLTGDEVYCTRFGDHYVTRDLSGVSVVFGHPLCVAVRQEVTIGLDRPKVTLLTLSDDDGWGESEPEARPRVFDPARDLPGPVAMAAAVEWGGNVASDVAFRPTRICVFGEHDFVMNGVLASRANANRDLFVNAVAWLAGVETGTAPSLGGDATLFTGMSRREWMSLTLAASLFLPLGLLGVFWFYSLISRRR